VYVANCKISSPIDIGVKSDVNLNGFHFSYKYGLMFPGEAEVEPAMVLPED
jgi:hypothetical protein